MGHCVFSQLTCVNTYPLTNLVVQEKRHLRTVSVQRYFFDLEDRGVTISHNYLIPDVLSFTLRQRRHSNEGEQRGDDEFLVHCFDRYSDNIMVLHFQFAGRWRIVQELVLFLQ